MNHPLFINIYIIPSLLISMIMVISSNSWFMIWVSLEYNLMSFIPFMIFTNKYYKESSIKYFIIQVLSSSIFIFCSNFQLLTTPINSYNMITIMNISILMKIGAAPFHSWLINLMSKLNWINCLILMSIQKISPMIILMYIYNFKLILLSTILSAIWGSMFGLNHQSLRLIMSFSSINHVGWMMMNLMISETLWFQYFVSYSMINSSIILIFYTFNIYYINQLFFIKNSMFMKLIILLNLFSISGLPPMFGFFIKWISLHMMIYNKFSIITILMIMLSVLTFLFYTRMALSFIIQFNINNKLLIINKMFNFNFKLSFIIILNSFLNLWILSIWFLY